MKNLTIIIITTLMLVFVLPMAKAKEQSSAADQTTNVQQAEAQPSNSQNNNDAEVELAKNKEQLSEAMQTLKAQLEKLEIEKQNLQRELAKLEESQLAVNNKIREQALQAAEKMKAAKDESKDSAEGEKVKPQPQQWQNTDAFVEWQQQMKQWQQELQQWQKQFESQVQEHGITEGTHENPNPNPMPHPAPPMPPMPPMPLNSNVHVNVPPDNGSAMVFTTKNGARVAVPKVNVPKIDVHVPPVIISSVRPTGPLDMVVPENENNKFESAREMELAPKIEPGASFVVQNKVGKIVLTPSQDGNCSVKAVIKAKADTTEKAQEMVGQVTLNNQSSSERYLLKTVKSGDDNWNNLSVDLYITVPSGIKLDVSTDVGNIEINNITAQIKAQTNTGSIKAVNINGETQLITKVGNIDVTAPKDISAKLQANTKVGSIVSDFPIDIEKTGITASTAKGTVGSGEKDIKLVTDVGQIRIKKQPLIED